MAVTKGCEKKKQALSSAEILPPHPSKEKNSICSTNTESPHGSEHHDVMIGMWRTDSSRTTMYCRIAGL